MCKEDIREGRKKFTTTRPVTLANATVTPLCPYAPNRTHLTVTSIGADAGVTPADDPAVINAAFHVGLGAHPVDVDIETHGNVVNSAWVGWGVAGAVVVLVIETFWEDDGQ